MINRGRKWPSMSGRSWPTSSLEACRWLGWVCKLEKVLERMGGGAPFSCFFSLLPRESPNGNSYIAGLLSAWAKDSGFLSAKASWCPPWSCPSTHWPAARLTCSSQKTPQTSGREVISNVKSAEDTPESQADIQEHARKRCSQRRKLQCVSNQSLTYSTWLFSWHEFWRGGGFRR